MLRKSSVRESGNIFFVLFGAVAVVGLLGTTIVTTLRGPLSTMVEVQARTQAESEMAIASRLALLEATELTNSGDCDSDGFVEPLEYLDAGGAGPTGGGFLPNAVSSAKVDPWGTEYGYCTWDAGSIAGAIGCDTDSNSVNERLNGNGSPTDETYSVIAVISAGPDQVFNTTCVGGASPSTSKAGDDLVVEYTYASANAASGGLWNIKSGDPNVAEISKDIEVTGGATFTGGLDLTAPTAQVQLGAASLLFPNDTTLTTCNGANDGLIRIDTSTNPNTLQLCDDPTGWVSVGGTIWQNGAGNDIFYNTGTPQVGIGNNSPSEALDVTGNIEASGNINSGGALNGATLSTTGNGAIGGNLGVTGASNLATVNATGAADFDSTLNADGATTLGSTVNVTGATTLSSTLDAQGNIRNSTGDLTLDDDIVVSGTSDIQGNIGNSTGDVTLNDDVVITGSTDAQGSISNSTGNINLSDNVDITNNLDVTGDIDATNITTSSDVNASGNINVNGDQLGPALNCSAAQKLVWTNGTGWSCTTDLQGGTGGGAPSLNDITDVAITSPAGDQCLIYNGGSGNWVNGACEEDLSDNTISELQNVNASGALFGQILIAAPSTAGSVEWQNRNITGDATLNLTGGLTISNNAVEETMLNEANGPTDEYCLTYEASTTNFEWQQCTNAASLVSSIDDLDDAYHDTTTDFDGDAADNDDNLALGHEFPALDGTNPGARNTAIGATALDTLTEGDGNVAVGYDAGTNVTTGYQNTISGLEAGRDLTTGYRNTFIGNEAGLSAEGAHDNVAIGYRAGERLDNGNDYSNVFIGNSAGRYNGGQQNVFIGGVAGNGASGSTTHTIAIGYASFVRGTGDENIVIGRTSGPDIEGDYNTILGQESGLSVTTGEQNILIGANTDTSAATASHEINIGSVLFGNIDDASTAGVDETQIGVGVADASAIDASALVEFNSTTRGLLAPRMDTTERDAIASPATGLMLYNTTDNSYQYYDGTNWLAIGDGAIAPDSLDWDDFADAMTLDATTTIDMDTNAANLNFDANTFVIDSVNNRIGVGTATPLSAFHVDGDGTSIRHSSSAGNVIFRHGSSYGIVGTSTNTDFAMRTNNLDRIRIDSGGNVGIATATPGSTLTVNGNFAVRTIGDSNNAFSINRDGSTSTVEQRNGATTTIRLSSSVATQSFFNSSNFVFGNTTADDSALVEIESTAQGFLPPRMTTAQRDGINSGTFATGLMVYNTDDNNYQYYDGTNWLPIGTGAIPADSIDWNDITDTMTLDATTTIDMDTNTASLNFDANTFVIDSANNNIGIDTASPIAALHINRNDNSSVSLRLDTNQANQDMIQIVRPGYNGGMRFNTGSSGIMHLEYGSAGIMRFDTNTDNIYFDNKIGFGTTTIDNSAQVQIESTTSGFLPPRMTTVQRDAINSGTFATGLTVYNTSTNTLQFYDGTAWQNASGAIPADSIDWDDITDTMTLDATTTIDMDTNTANLNFDTNTFVIDSANNRIGVGTATPQQTLDVNGNIAIPRGSTYGVEHLGAFRQIAGVDSANSVVLGSLTSNTNTRVRISTAGELSFESNDRNILFRNGPLGTETARIDTNGALSIGSGTSADNSSLVDLTSTTLGFLPPRMTTVQRDAINSGTFATGLTVYNTTTNTLQFYDGTTWQNASSGSVTLAIDGLTDAFHDTTTDFDGDTNDNDDNLALGHEFTSLDGTNPGARNTAIGATALESLTTGDNNIAIGYGAASNVDTKSDTLAIGYNALRVYENLGNSAPIAIGKRALNNYVGIAGQFSPTVIGHDAFENLTTGGWNTALGRVVGSQITTGTQNTFIGDAVGQFGRNGNSSTAVGAGAMYSAGGDNNTAVGTSALYGSGGTNQVTTRNTAVGRSAGRNISGGQNNLFLGYQAGDSTTSGSNNVIIGYDVDATSATASNELNIGDTIFGNLSTGNVGIGTATPIGDKLTVGAYETPAFTLFQDQTIGVYGANAAYFRGRKTSSNVEYLFGVSTSNEVFVSSFTNAPFDIRMGTGDIKLSIHPDGRTGIGTGVTSNIDASALLHLESTDFGFLPPRMTTVQRDAINSGTFATGLTVYNTTTNALQFYDGTTWQNASSGSITLAIDGLTDALHDTTTDFDGDGNNDDDNLALGHELSALDGTNPGARNTVIGATAGDDLTTGDDNVAIGYNAGTNITTGFSNTLVGSSAGDTVRQGESNTLIGNFAGQSIRDSDHNTFIGDNAGAATQNSGGSNIAIGSLALGNNVSGSNNVMMGRNTATNGSNNATLANNTVIGHEAGYNLGNNSGDNAENNLLLGYQAGDILFEGDNNIIIGYDIDPSSASASNEVNIGNLIYGNIADGSATGPKDQVGIGVTDASTIDTSALLELASTTHGFLAPRMTSTNRDAITLPASSLLIFNTTDNEFQFNAGLPTAPNWLPISGAACADATPDAFNFTDLANQTTSTLVTSNIEQITGVTCAVTASISGDGGAQLRTCSDASCASVIDDWATSAQINNNEYIQIRLTSPSLAGQTNEATVTVGNSSDFWTVSTTSGDCTVASPPIGTTCADGSIYVGLSPDGNVKMYSTQCDFGETWNGSTCTGSAASLTWSTTGTIFNGFNNSNTGFANTYSIDALANADAPYNAADACANLNENTRTDWYLPANNELTVLYSSGSISDSAYWGSTEGSIGGAGRIVGGILQPNIVKTTNMRIRCVRREGASPPATPPAGSDGEIQFNDSGALGADSTFVWDDTNNRLGIGTATPTGDLDVHDSTGASSMYISTDVNLGSGNTTSLIFSSDTDGTPNTATLGQFNDGSLRFSGAGNIVNPDMIIESANGSIGVSTGSVDSSAIFQIDATDRGFLPPRMTTVQRDAINSGTFASGLTVYNTTTNTLQFYDGTAWQNASATAGLIAINDLTDAYKSDSLANVFIGHEATTLISESAPGDNNTVLGITAGNSLTTGDRNTLLGSNAGTNLTDRSDNVIIGYNTGNSTSTSYRSVIIGNFAGQNAGYQNTLVGERAGRDTTGTDNTFIGRAAGEQFTTGNGNIILGTQAEGAAFTSGNSNIMIGYFITPSATAANREINIGNTLFGNIDNSSTGALTETQIAIGVADASAIETSAIFEVSSTEKGFLPPRMTTVQRDAINSGTFATGLTVYNTTTSTLQFYNGTTWQNAGGTPNAAGADREIQFNDGGALGASAAYAYNAAGDLELYGGGNSSGNKADFEFFRYRGSLASPTTVQDADQVGTIRFYVHDGTNYFATARIAAVVNEDTISTNDIATDLAFYAGDNGEGNEVARILGERPILVAGSDLDEAENFLTNSDGSIAVFSTNPDIESHVWGADKGDLTFTKMQGTPATPTTIVDGDEIGAIRWAGYTGSADRRRATITGIVNGSVTGNNVPIDIVFKTTDGADDEGLERMRIAANGLTSFTSQVNMNSIATVADDFSVATTVLSVNAFDRMVGIGAAPTDVSAILNVTSTTAGFLPPRMTTTQRDAINSGTFATGLTVYNTTTNALQFYDGTAWQNASASAGLNIGDLGDASTDYTTDFNMFMGNNAGANHPVGAQYNIAIGQNALDDAGKTAAADSNIAVGYNALTAITTGNNHIAIGSGALRSNTDGITSIAIGTDALRLSTSSDNLAIGTYALWHTTTGYRNMAIGNLAMNAYNSGGFNNIAIGWGAFSSATSGGSNTILGDQAMSNSTGANTTVAIGKSALLNATGSQNTAIGYLAGDLTTTGSSNILIGSDIDASSATASNELNIGDTIFGDLTQSFVGIGTNSPQEKLHISDGGIQMHGDNDDLEIFSYSTGAGQEAGLKIYRSRGTEASPFTALADGDEIGEISFYGSTNSNFHQAAGISVVATNGGWTSGTARDVDMIFSVSEGFGDFSERMRIAAEGRVSIGTGAAADASALLELTSTDTGFLPPRMTTTERDAINSGTFATGLIVYNTTTNTLQFYDGTSWQTAGGTPTLAINDLTDATTDATNSNMFIGHNGGAFGTNNSGNVSLGLNALISLNNDAGTNTGDDNTAIGNLALTDNTTGYRNTAIGSDTLATNTTGNRNTAIGWSALNANTTGNTNSAVGIQALEANTTGFSNNAFGQSALLTNTTGSSNIAIGGSALRRNTTASNNVAVGANALTDNTTGSRNLAIGNFSLDENTTGASNIAVGDGALGDHVDGQFNTGVGTQALRYVTSGINNVGFGSYSLRNNTEGSNNTAIGFEANGLITPTDGFLEGNVLLGYRAGYTLTGGATLGDGADYNTLLGFQAGDIITTGDDNIIIGNNTDPSSATASNELNIGNTLYGDLSNDYIGIGNPTPDVALDVTGDIEYSGTITDVSDRRLKTNIKTLNTKDVLTRISKIDTYSFTMKDDPKNRTEFGVMAQELEKIFPELVHTAKDEMGTKSVNYVGLIAPMIEATKELKSENESLKADLAQMRSGQQEIMATLTSMQKDMAGIKVHTGFGFEKANVQSMLIIFLMMMLSGGAVLIITQSRKKEK